MDYSYYLKEFALNRFLATQIVFAHRHPQESPAFHQNILSMWSAQEQFVYIEAFRGGAKSSLCEESVTLEAAYQNFRYCLIFGETYTKACQRLESIKYEIVNNKYLNGMFGPLYKKGLPWAENKIVLTNGVCIEAHGWEEEIRGYKHGTMRPDRVMLDDIESKESTRDTNTVEANWRKIHIQLVPALDVDAKIRAVGTPLADDCLINRYKASEFWAGASFPICDGDPNADTTTALWPQRYPMEWIREKYRMFEQAGMLREFNQEFMLIATGSQGKPFDETMLHEQDIEPTVYAPRKVIIDPARTVEVKTSDQTGYVVASRIGTRIYVHESGGEYLQPDAIVDKGFELCKRHGASLCIERNSLDEWLMQPIRAQMLRTASVIDVEPILAPSTMSKTDFIMSLRPFFISGDVILIGGRAKHAKLVQQILNFPTGKRDVLNALAYTLRVFSGVPVYGDFSEANIAHDLEPKRGDILLLAINSTNTETTAALIATDGRRMDVLMDWASPLPPSDCVSDIMSLVRKAFPDHRIQPYAPGEVHDMGDRSGLLRVNSRIRKAGYAASTRGSLSPLLRTASNNRRLMLVDASARNTLYAMSQGYNWPIRAGGERGAEPVRGISRTLVEAIEALTAVAKGTDNEPIANATTPTGARYISALRH